MLRVSSEGLETASPRNRDAKHRVSTKTEQIKDKNYGERFMNDTRPHHYLGIGFVGKQIGYQLVINGENECNKAE